MPKIMQLKHLQSISQPSDGIVKVTAICWAPNGKRLAVCTTDRLVLMFDEEGNRKDKFSTKPADKVRKSCVYNTVRYPFLFTHSHQGLIVFVCVVICLSRAQKTILFVKWCFPLNPTN